MARNGLAHDFAPVLELEPAPQLPAIPDGIRPAFSDLSRHMRVMSCPRPAATSAEETPSLKAAWVLASITTVFAVVLIWSAAAASLKTGAATAHSGLLTLTRPWPLIGVCGWAYGLIFTALFIWR